MTMGCRALRNFVPAQDSEIVVRFKKSGLVILGKTNVPELGLLGITEPELHGPGSTSVPLSGPGRHFD